MRLKPITREILDELKDELEFDFTKKQVERFVDLGGFELVVFMALNRYDIHGKYCYPTTHKYYRELTFWIIRSVKHNMKQRLYLNSIIYGGDYVAK